MYKGKNMTKEEKKTAEKEKIEAQIKELKIKGHGLFVAREQGQAMVTQANNALMKNLNEIQALESKLKEK